MHPCCSSSLQTGVKIIAIAQIVCAILLVGSGVAALIFESKGLTAQHLAESVRITRDTEVVVSSITQISGGIFTLVTAIVLLNGAIRRNRSACIVWFVLNAFSLIFSLFSCVKAYPYEEDPYFVGRFIGLVILSYFLCVVCAFMKELYEEELEQEARDAPAKLMINNRFKV